MLIFWGETFVLFSLMLGDVLGFPSSLYKQTKIRKSGSFIQMWQGSFLPHTESLQVEKFQLPPENLKSEMNLK